MVHRTAAEGFVRPDTYEKGRPDYPRDTLAAIGVRAGTEVVDIGCGTGKLTRMLASTDAAVIGVEPLPPMLAKFHELCPDVPAVSAVAEALPFRDGSFDIVTCASAFHWFDHDRALPEIRRCLRPGGRLAIVWNRRDRLTGWAAEFWQITEAHRSGTPSYRTGVWRDAIERSGMFEPIEEHWFDHVQRTDVEGLLARIGSISFIETLPPDERDGVLDEAKRFLQTHPSTKDSTTFELPYKTAVYVTRAS